MREEVELLEDDPHPLAYEIEVPALHTGAGAGPLQMSWPSRKISPSSGGSSRLMHRSRVLLPEPLGPEHADDFAAGAARRGRFPRNTSRSPNRFWTAANFSIGSVKRLRRPWD